MVDPVTIGLGISAIGTLFGIGSSIKAGQDAERIGRENAATLREMTDANIAIALAAANFNAGSVLRVGEANASAIEDVYERNSELMAYEGVEEIRRHFIEEKQTLGTIRAMQGGVGSQVNTGTNLHYFLDQAYEGEYSRYFQANRIKTSILNYRFEQQTRADLTRLDARERAAAIRFNADLESQVALNESNARAIAMERGGQLNSSLAFSNAFQTALNGASDLYKIWNS